MGAVDVPLRRIRLCGRYSPRQLRLEFVDLEWNYVKRAHHFSVMRADPVRTSDARHHSCRRIGHQCTGRRC
ncbi:hypothetical protein C2845_PM17G06900 [Panicum miliaceum]|uniref:Uncharacterized protein n=1 Tax=Panicum miliaceum TaxID=4540 RepID=A0A3L6Q431_PANMI|nr:hypothetical protein C2845_PM17G06900 [Panicum miliaceum]